MGFDLYGKNENSSFRNNCWWWRPLQALITYACNDVLSVEDADNLGYNNGYFISKDKAERIADKLEKVLNNEKKLRKMEKQIMGVLPKENYGDCWSRTNIWEFIKFCRGSNGFYIC